MAIWWLIYLISLAFLGYLFLNLKGMLVVLILGAAITIFFQLYGDRIVLGLINARTNLLNRDLWRRTNNVSSKLGVSGVEFYKAPSVNSNIYFLQSYLGKKSIVFGGEIESLLSEKEMEALIYACLRCLKKGEGKPRLVLGLVNYYLNLPLVLFGKYSFLRPVSIIYYYLRSPVLILNNYFFGLSFYKSFDLEIAKETGLGSELASVVYKISSTSEKNHSFLQKNIMNSLTYADNKSDNSSSLLNSISNSEERFKLLMSEK